MGNKKDVGNPVPVMLDTDKWDFDKVTEPFNPDQPYIPADGDIVSAFGNANSNPPDRLSPINK